MAFELPIMDPPGGSSGGGTSLFSLNASVGLDASTFAQGVQDVLTAAGVLQNLLTVISTDVTQISKSLNDLVTSSASDAKTAAESAETAIGGVSTAADGAAAAADETEKAVNKMGSSADSGSSWFSNFASAASAAWSAVVKLSKQLWELGVQVVGVAADIEMEERRFAMAFIGIEDEATQAMMAVADRTGIHFSRIRGNFASIQTQLIAAGFDSVTALGMTQNAMMLAANASALYGVSLDDATARLLSFMRGNTEAGEAIGFMVTSASRDEYASRMYGVKWKDLTEQQRETLLLQIALDTYARGGFNDAAQEFSESYYNSLQNLQSIWRELQGTLGRPIMDAVTPVLTELFEWLSSPEMEGVVEEFASLVGEVVAAIAGLLKEFIAWAGSEEGQKAVDKVMGFVRSIFNFFGFGEVDTYTSKGGVDDVLDAVGWSQTEGEEKRALAMAWIQAAEQYYAETDDDVMALFDPGEWAAEAALKAARSQAQAQMTPEEYQAVLGYIAGIRTPYAGSGDYRYMPFSEGFLTTGAGAFLEQLFPNTTEEIAPALEGVSGALQNLPGMIASALAGVTVQMDGVAVGHIVAPTVMGDMAWAVTDAQFTG